MSLTKLASGKFSLMTKSPCFGSAIWMEAIASVISSSISALDIVQCKIAWSHVSSAAPHTKQAPDVAMLLCRMTAAVGMEFRAKRRAKTRTLGTNQNFISRPDSKQTPLVKMPDHKSSTVTVLEQCIDNYAKYFIRISLKYILTHSITPPYLHFVSKPKGFLLCPICLHVVEAFVRH